MERVFVCASLSPLFVRIICILCPWRKKKKTRQFSIGLIQMTNGDLYQFLLTASPVRVICGQLVLKMIGSWAGLQLGKTFRGSVTAGLHHHPSVKQKKLCPQMIGYQEKNTLGHIAGLLLDLQLETGRKQSSHMSKNRIQLELSCLQCVCF